MTLVTITTKGQVTIPKKIRELLNLKSGDKIEIVSTEKGEAIIRPVSKKVDDVFCKLYDPNRKMITVEDMDEAIKERIRENFQ